MAHRTLTETLSALALAVPVLSLSAWAVVADAQDNKPAATIDDRAVEVLQQFIDHIAGLEAYSTTVNQLMTMKGPFGDEQTEEEFTLAVAQPNRFALRSAAEFDNEAVVSDGKHFNIVVPMFGAYVQTDAPEDLQSLFMSVQNDTLMLGGLPTSLLTPLFGPGGPDGALGALKSASYAGTEQLEGAEVHRLNLVVEPHLTESAKQRLQEEMGEQAEMVFHVSAWIGAGDEPRVHQLEYDLAKMLASMMPDMFEAMPQMSEMQYDMVMVFNDWKTGADVTDDQFAFEAPEGAEQLASMDELMEKLEQAMAGPSGSPEELLGEAAPDFDMQLLDGGTVTGAQHRGNDILILDFWATWCGPCIQAMPALMQVAEAYEDRNVILYAINVREEPGSVENFLEEREWTLNVPLDRDGGVSRKFKVGGIPQTVIIDKDGTVQAVHVGYSPSMKQQLERELDTLLRGEKLVEPGDNEAGDESPGGD